MWKIYLNAPAVDGKANKALIALLAEHFNVRKGQIEIIKGLKLRCKTISINDVTTYGVSTEGAIAPERRSLKGERHSPARSPYRVRASSTLTP